MVYFKKEMVSLMNRDPGYKIVAMDLDGTLNDDEKKITPVTCEALMRAQQAGIRLILASARPSPGLYRERDALKIADYGGMLMSYNGGCIADAATNRILAETRMDMEATRRVLLGLEALPVTVILDDRTQFFVEDRDGYKVQYECFNNAMSCTEVERLSSFLDFAPFKLLMSVQPEQLVETQKRIAAFLPDDMTVVQTAPFYLEVIPRAVNKGQGIADICRVLGLSTDEVIAFGDSENDIPMLRRAGMGIAMANATPATKEAADRITLSNNDDGIAAALRELMPEIFDR